VLSSIPRVTESDAGADSRYSMGIVTRRTGLSPDVLRVWERRHAVVSPTRSAGGQRLYSAADIEKLRLLRILVDAGHRIASVAPLPIAALADLVRDSGTPEPELNTSVGPADAIVGDLMRHVAALDAGGLEAALRRSAMQIGIETWIENVVGPLFDLVGEQWHAGVITPAHEHLATVTAREVLSWAMRSFGVSADAPSILVATPAGEQHELGAMMAAVVAAGEGWRVHYLGPDVPAADLAAAATQLRARVIALSLVHPDHAERSVDEVRRLRRALPADIPVIIGGAAAEDTAASLAGVGGTIARGTGAFRAELALIKPAT
jgi:methanogenic corrinoid protein MtbC1